MSIRLRPGKQSDYEFLWWLHGATMRTYVEAIWGWEEAAQRKLFEERFDPARFQIVERDGEDVVQSQVIGTGLIRDLQDEAARHCIPLKLRVLQGNPARHLYEQLGFVAMGETETHIMMSWRPRTMAIGDRGEPR
jgi:GNAT superfamily N-acetyltransferase